MHKNRLIHLPEPTLTFGYNQKVADPRDGLTLFGPYSKDKVSGQVNIGIIGPENQRQQIKEYLQKIHLPVFGASKEIARPFFPGLETTYGIHVNFKALKEIDVFIGEIEKFLKYTDKHQRVHQLANLYADRLIEYQKQEEASVDLWFIAIPDSIYAFGRPKSIIPKSEENIKESLNKKDRDPNVLLLFDEMSTLQEAYQYEVNFHNQIKAKILNHKIVTQIIRESTISYRSIWTNEKKVASEMKFDTAKAWNIATAMYYKVGGLPWKLGDARERVCYLGLVYKKLENSDKGKNACCAAQMFLSDGDGLVFRGNIGPWFNPKTGEYHLSQRDAEILLTKALEMFKNKSVTNEYPEEVFIHAKTNFNQEEWLGFQKATENKSAIIGVRIKDSSSFKLYRDLTYAVPRGTVYLHGDEHRAFLWTKGFVPRLQTQIGLETPNPLNIEITRGTADIVRVCKDVLALTKLNYNACIFGDGIPVTLRFANSIGEVLTAGPNIASDILPFKHYI